MCGHLLQCCSRVSPVHLSGFGKQPRAKSGLMKFLMAPAVVLLLLQLTAPTAARLFFSSRYVNPRYSFSGQEVRLTDRYLPL